jgi:hypothetical protein
LTAAVPLYHTGGQRSLISVHHSLYPPLSAMKNPKLLYRRCTQMKNPQMYADDHVHVQHCDTTPMLPTPQRSAHEDSSSAFIIAFIRGYLR